MRFARGECEFAIGRQALLVLWNGATGYARGHLLAEFLFASI